jgi:hypothetical protein
MMSNENPSGNIPESDWYRRLLIVCVVVAVTTAVKRFYIGLMQGRRLYIRYGEDLSRIMERALLISKVGKLARDIETFRLRFENFDLKVASYDTEDEPQGANAGQLNPAVFHAASKKARLSELLGEWEEPDIENEDEVSEDKSSRSLQNDGLSEPNYASEGVPRYQRYHSVPTVAVVLEFSSSVWAPIWPGKYASRMR